MIVKKYQWEEIKPGLFGIAGGSVRVWRERPGCYRLVSVAGEYQSPTKHETAALAAKAARALMRRRGRAPAAIRE